MDEKPLDELNMKIAQIIHDLGFSSSQFADYIGVGRPIISHITKGRNKPSLDIVQNIIQKFPELGFEWTMDGRALDKEMLRRIAGRLDEEQREQEMLRLQGMGVGFISKEDSGNRSVSPASNGTMGKGKAGEKQIKKIVVFYSDNSFTEFNPA